HGRMPHDAYTGAVVEEHKFSSMKSGDPCPASNCKGKLYSKEPETIISLKGCPPVSATKHIAERLKCSLCGLVYSALRQGISRHKYDASVIAIIALLRYGYGLP